MAKYQTIAVIYGSDSSESEVSCRSGEFVASRLDQNLYNVYEIYARFGKWSLVACRNKNSMRVTFPEMAQPQVDKSDFSVTVLGEKIKFDFAYIVQHGRPGETGQIEGYFEMIGVPFSTCSSYVSTMVFDKFSCKNQIRYSGLVRCAPDVFIRQGFNEEEGIQKAIAELQFPVFVKPTQSGSSYGITRVTEPAKLAEAVRVAFREGDSVIIEQGVQGRELTCAAYKDGNGVSTLPLIEIISENEYFDYDAKYNGHSQEVCPAVVPDHVRDEIQDITARLYSYLGCSGLVRIDYIYSEDGPYFLEVNTIPGMTSASLVPRMISAAGMDITDFLTGIIENS